MNANVVTSCIESGIASGILEKSLLITLLRVPDDSMEVILRLAGFQTVNNLPEKVLFTL